MLRQFSPYPGLIFIAESTALGTAIHPLTDFSFSKVLLKYVTLFLASTKGVSQSTLSVNDSHLYLDLDPSNLVYQRLQFSVLLIISCMYPVCRNSIQRFHTLHE